MFELLRQIAYGAEHDPEVRLAELRRRRQAIDAEIAQVERGNVAVLDRALVEGAFGPSVPLEQERISYTVIKRTLHVADWFGCAVAAGAGGRVR